MLRKIGIAAYIVWVKIKQIFRKKQKGNILIIKPDAIGDYIIFRNFLSIIAKDKKYANHKITMVGNIIWKQFACEFDAEIIDRFISVNHKTLNKEWISILNEVDKVNYDFVITFCYSRAFLTDVIAFVASSKHKVGLNGDNIRMSASLKNIFNKTIYNDLVDVPGVLKTEFEFNKFLTEHFLNAKLSIAQPFLNLNFSKKLFDSYLNLKYVVFAPGAGVFNRQPSVDKLIKIASFVLEKYSICFIGSTEDARLTDEIIDNISSDNESNKIINLTGKAPLHEIPYILNDSLCVICNDSAVYHLSMAINKPTLCIAGGGHFNRFVKYTNHENVRICYEKMACFNCDWFCIFKFPVSEPYPCVNIIDLNKIYMNFASLEKRFEN
jgi:ADP-heptose:LPS heptosyltransferase